MIGKCVALLLVACLGTALTGCGSPSLTCQTTSCSSGTLTYQICVLTEGAVQYKYGGASCTCSQSGTGCEMCSELVASYCVGGGGTLPVDGGADTGSRDAGHQDGGGRKDASIKDSGKKDSGSKDAGGKDATDAGPHACTYSVTGATTATGTCTVAAAYNKMKAEMEFTVTASGSTTTFGFGCSIPGQTTLTDGTYTLADVAAGAGASFVVLPTSAWFLCSDTANCSGAMPPQGSFSLTVSDPGPSVGGLLWESPSGTLTLTMPAAPSGSATGTVTVDVTL